MAEARKKTAKEIAKKHGVWVTALSSALLVFGEKLSDKIFPELTSKGITRKEVIYIVDSCSKPIYSEINTLKSENAVFKTQFTGMNSTLTNIELRTNDMNNNLVLILKK